VKIRIVTITTLGAVLLAACSPAHDLNNRGNAALSENRAAEAIVQFNSAMALQPDAPIPYYNAALAYRAGESLDSAALALEQALDSADETLKEQAYYNLGVVYYEMGRFGDAVAAFREALILDPTDAQTRYNYELAMLYDVDPTPENQQQQTEPEEQQTDPNTTPTNQPNALDGPTPTPPRQDTPPDLTATPEGGSGDFASDTPSTLVPQENGRMTMEEAQRLLDLVTDDQQALSEFLRQLIASGEPSENDW
jgi:tetratricopeptide (TPR) repeat protein